MSALLRPSRDTSSVFVWILMPLLLDDSHTNMLSYSAVMRGACDQTLTRRNLCFRRSAHWSMATEL